MTVFIYLVILTLILTTAPALWLFRKISHLERRQEQLFTRWEERLGTLENRLAMVEEDSDAAPEIRADDRKKAREAERRFTEGVANILGFSCGTGGGRGD